jgi:tetratricopeptide (TPR) repeat protein
MGVIVERCLNPQPAGRYSSFQEIRGALEPIMFQLAGIPPTIPTPGDQTVGFWNNKGISLAALRYFDDAIVCYDKALAINPRYAQAWYNKGISLVKLERREEAADCFRKTSVIDPQYSQTTINKSDTSLPSRQSRGFFSRLWRSLR